MFPPPPAAERTGQAVETDSAVQSEAPAEPRKEGTENTTLTARLLELRTHGRPPFLVRTLGYVVADKARANRQMWDLRWSELSARNTNAPRHLVLNVAVSRCLLAPRTTQQLLHPATRLAEIDPFKLPAQLEARVRMTLAARRKDGTSLTFSLRNQNIRVWPTEYVSNGIQVQDVTLRETFDLSTIVAVLGSDPAALSLIVEVYSDAESAKPLNAYASRLRGELVLIDVDATEETTVRNGRTRLALRFESAEMSDIPAEAAPRRKLSAPQFSPQSFRDAEVVDLDEALPDNDVIATSASSSLSNIFASNSPVRNRRITQVGRSITSKPTAPQAQLPPDIPLAANERPRDAWIDLELSGTMQRAAEHLRSTDKPGVHIACTYKSKELPHWDGIVRNDFVCPWCHRNCHRYRTLLAHFQFEHDQMHFEVMGIQKGTKSREVSRGIPFVFNFEVKSASEGKFPMTVTRKAVQTKYDDNGGPMLGWDEGPEEIWANPVKYRSYLYSISPQAARERMQDEELHTSLRKVNISAADNSDVISIASTEYEGDSDRSFVQIIRDELKSSCKLCDRPHGRMNANGCEKSLFCSDYCESSYRKKEIECLRLENSAINSTPFLQQSSASKSKRINYKESLGKLELYHIVSVCRAKEEHFDDDEPDSEEEVDQSWRLDIASERVRHLEGVSAKEKVLWMMWDQHAHENYPLPSVYGTRYTRFTLEKFAFEYGPQIERLKLRVPFFGFLRALHVHGTIDCVAITSIMLCLDRKKKRRHINVSDRPELPLEVSTRAGRGRGSIRGRKGRRAPVRRS